MRPSDRERAEELRVLLEEFSSSQLELRGIRSRAFRDAFIEQIIESLRRVEYIKLLADGDWSGPSVNPAQASFDPQKAAVTALLNQDFEEALWLVFLITHFGRHRALKWELLRRVYLGDGAVWTWARVSRDPDAFRDWLDANHINLKPSPSSFGFGNHRKYQSIDARSPNGTGEAVESYVKLISRNGSHAEFFDAAIHACAGDLRCAFERLYAELGAVASFGRTARFDYLTMVAKLGFVELVTPRMYLAASTGPISGANLLIHGKKTSGTSPARLEEIYSELAAHLKIDVSILEDALCNWQKSPGKFVPFRG